MRHIVAALARLMFCSSGIVSGLILPEPIALGHLDHHALVSLF